MIHLHPNQSRLITTAGPILLRGRFYGTIRQVRAGVVLQSTAEQQVFTCERDGVTIVASGPEASLAETEERALATVTLSKATDEALDELAASYGVVRSPAEMATLLGGSPSQYAGFFPPAVTLTIPWTEPKHAAPSSIVGCEATAQGVFCELPLGHPGNHRKSSVEWA